MPEPTFDPAKAAVEPTKTITISSQTGIPDQMHVVTPAGSPNVTFNVISPFLVALKRVARIYIYAFAGIYPIVLGDVAPGVLIVPHDFVGKLTAAAGLSLAPAFMALLSNAVEIVKNW